MIFDAAIHHSLSKWAQTVPYDNAYYGASDVPHLSRSYITAV